MAQSLRGQPARATTPEQSELSKPRTAQQWGLRPAPETQQQQQLAKVRRTPLPTALRLAQERTTPFLGTSSATQYETSTQSFFGRAPALEPAFVRRNREELGFAPAPGGPPRDGSQRGSQQPSVAASRASTPLSQQLPGPRLPTPGSRASSRPPSEASQARPAEAKAEAAGGLPKMRRTRGDFSVRPRRDAEDYQLQRTAEDRRKFQEFAALVRSGGAAGNTIPEWPYRKKGAALGLVQY